MAGMARCKKWRPGAEVEPAESSTGAARQAFVAAHPTSQQKPTDGR